MNTLSIDQKRILLAQWAGMSGEFLQNEDLLENVTLDHETGAEIYKTVPSYFTSLDAVAELEARLTDEERDVFIAKLCEICGGVKEAYFATAAQCAEAIGQTLNLWKQP